MKKLLQAWLVVAVLVLGGCVSLEPLQVVDPVDSSIGDAYTCATSNLIQRGYVIQSGDRQAGYATATRRLSQSEFKKTTLDAKATFSIARNPSTRSTVINWRWVDVHTKQPGISWSEFLLMNEDEGSSEQTPSSATLADAAFLEAQCNE